MLIVDFRFRPPFKGFLNLHVYARPADFIHPGLMGVPPAPSRVHKSLDLMFQEMDEAGISVGCLLGRRAIPPFSNVPNEDVVEFARMYPDRFVAMPCIEPTDRVKAMEELEFLLTQPEVKAIHLEPAWAAVPRKADDPNLYPIYDRCARAGMPVVISSGGTIGPDFTWINPIYVQHVANDFPNLKIAIAHGGWPWVHQALAVAYACPNVYLSADMYLNVPNMPGNLEYVRSANFFLGDRLIFGTAYPARPMLHSVKSFMELPFASDEIREKVLGLNALRFFGMELPR